MSKANKVQAAQDKVTKAEEALAKAREALAAALAIREIVVGDRVTGVYGRVQPEQIEGEVVAIEKNMALVLVGMKTFKMNVKALEVVRPGEPEGQLTLAVDIETLPEPTVQVLQAQPVETTVDDDIKAILGNQADTWAKGVFPVADGAEAPKVIAVTGSLAGVSGVAEATNNG